MSVAKVTEITATSPEGFEHAVHHGLERASKTIDNIQSAWVNEMHVEVENGKPTGYRVNLKITFILKD